MTHSTLSTLLLLGLIGCSGGPFPAPATAVLGDFEDLTLVPSSAHVSQDGIGSLLIADALVTDEKSGEPLNNIEVEVLTGWSGIYVIPETAVKLVDYPEAPADVDPDDPASVAAYCDRDPEDGMIDADAEDWCSWYWDAGTGAYYEFGGDYAMTPDNYQPTYMIGGTDVRGICRFYLYVDSLPYDGEAFTSASVWVSIGVDSTSFAIDVENN